MHVKNSWSCVGKAYSQEMTEILLSDSTIKTPIDELAKSIECQVLKNFHFFSFNVINNCYFPIVADFILQYVRFNSRGHDVLQIPRDNTYIEQKMYLNLFPHLLQQ